MSKIGFIERFIFPIYDREPPVTLARVTVDRGKCNGCGMCVSVCPSKTLVLAGTGKERKAGMEEGVTPECMSCNDCAAMCERGAVKVTTTYDFNYHFKIIDRGAMAAARHFSEGS